MHAVGEYIFSVCVAALLCGLLTPLLKKGPAGDGAKLITGIFLLLTVLRPLTGIDLPALENLTAYIRSDVQQAVLNGEEKTHQEFSGIIKERSAAYILQKAEALGLQITVNVIVSEDTLPIPQAVYLTGAAAPYAKKQLQDVIQRDLGIAKENMIWT